MVEKIYTTTSTAIRFVPTPISKAEPLPHYPPSAPHKQPSSTPAPPARRADVDYTQLLGKVPTFAFLDILFCGLAIEDLDGREKFAT